MKKRAVGSILNHYNSLYKKFGTSPKSLGWLKGNQGIRFNILTEIGNVNKCSILDVGCGFGDLYNFLKKKGYKIKYHGVDLNPKFVEIAKESNPGVSFGVRDIQKKKLKRKFDWVFASGITNHANNYPNLKSQLKEMFRVSRKGVAMDFISNYVDYKEKDIFYSSPEKIFKIAKNLSKRVIIRHDYMPYEFCLYVFKNDKKNKKNVFDEYYRNVSRSVKEF